MSRLGTGHGRAEARTRRCSSEQTVGLVQARPKKYMSPWNHGPKPGRGGICQHVESTGVSAAPWLNPLFWMPHSRRAHDGAHRLAKKGSVLICTLPTQGLLDDHASHTFVASGDSPRVSECDSHQHVKYRESGSHRVITECDIHGTLAAQVASLHSPTRTKCGQSCSGTRTRAC